jgi:predicted transcriptional regulator
MPDTSDDVLATFANTEKTFFELASEQRLAIVFRLNNKSAKISQLAKDLDITMQEVHRNVSRLQDAGLIEKDPEGMFSLTTFGNTIIKQIPTFNYLSKYKEYFSEHILGELPIKFIMRLGALDKCGFIKGIVAILERWKDIYREADQYIYEIVPQVPIDLIEPAVTRVKASVLFPTQKGETDMNMLFFSRDYTFHEWCLDYFRYRWYGSDIFDESRLKEI